MKKLTFVMLVLCIMTACGQTTQHHIHQIFLTMNTDKINNPVAKAAITAWQNADQEKWLSLFTADVQLFDDGHPRDFKKFSSEAIGQERFTSVDKVEENGTVVYGKFHSATWGDFKTYFRFHINDEEKIYRLDIGQADY